MAIATNLGLGHTAACDRSSVGKWLALRPEFSAQALMPPTALLAPRGGRRGLLVLTAGPVQDFLSALSHRLGGFVPTLTKCAGVLALSFRAIPTETREGLTTMTRTEHSRALQRRAELTHDRGPRQLEPAIDARRRLNTRRSDSTRTNQDPHGPSELRYACLTRSHD
jgi:hypothetical protein